MTKNYRAQAEALAGKGRYGDTTLMHVNEAEVEALEGIAGLFGRELTENPDTGLKEAFNLFDILPFALNFIFPGMGTAAQIGIGALSGAASGAIEGTDPLMGALTGGAMSGIGSALFGGADPAKLATEQLATQSGGKMFADELGQLAINQATDAAGTKLFSELGQPLVAGTAGTPAAAASDFWDVGGVNPKVQGWLDDPLSSGNLPWTLAGGAALASMMPPNMLGENETGDEEGRKAHLRYPAAPRPYQPLNTPDLNTYGQLGSDYQSEVNYFLNNPGPYTGAPYEGDPYAYPFKEGGLACYGGGGMIVAQNRLKALQNRNNKYSDAGSFTLPARQIIQNSNVPQASIMPVGQPSFNPVNFSPVTSFQPAPQTMGAPASFTPVRGFAGGGGIASMGGGSVDPRIIEQLMARGGGEIEGSDPGMADTVPASIDGQAPARLSSGEYVVPADVVSMLGDGNTKAGAQVLRSMVERVRLYKTGSAGQAAEIDPEQVLPA